MLNKMEKSLIRLEAMRDEGKNIAVSAIKETGSPQTDPTEPVNRFLKYITITPQNMDPSGIIPKLEHILDVRDTRFKDEVRSMAPEAEETQTNNLENMLEAALTLNNIYKMVRHYHLLGKKTMRLYTIMEVQMQLPQIMKQAEAYTAALKAFSQGEPIGDGGGALVAAKLMRGHEKRKIAKDMVMAQMPIEGRKSYVIKAEGPGANVGKPGEAIKNVVEGNEGKIDLVIMVDAALKLEGETVGDVTEGIGAAIGGPGVDQIKIEESVLEHKIPLNAVAIKEGVGDAISPMRKELVDCADGVIQRIKRLITEQTKEGDTVIITGVGNTIGIGQ